MTKSTKHHKELIKQQEDHEDLKKQEDFLKTYKEILKKYEEIEKINNALQEEYLHLEQKKVTKSLLEEIQIKTAKIIWELSDLNEKIKHAKKLSLLIPAKNINKKDFDDVESKIQALNKKVLKLSLALKNKKSTKHSLSIIKTKLKSFVSKVKETLNSVFNVLKSIAKNLPLVAAISLKREKEILFFKNDPEIKWSTSSDKPLSKDKDAVIHTHKIDYKTSREDLNKYKLCLMSDLQEDNPYSMPEIENQKIYLEINPHQSKTIDYLFLDSTGNYVQGSIELPSLNSYNLTNAYLQSNKDELLSKILKNISKEKLQPSGGAPI